MSLITYDRARHFHALGPAFWTDLIPLHLTDEFEMLIYDPFLDVMSGKAAKDDDRIMRIAPESK